MDLDLEKLSVEELAAGIAYEAQEESYRCIHCAARFMTGEIYAVDGRYFEAKRAAEYHLAQAHGARRPAGGAASKRQPLPATDRKPEGAAAQPAARGERPADCRPGGDIPFNGAQPTVCAAGKGQAGPHVFGALCAGGAKEK